MRLPVPEPAVMEAATLLKQERHDSLKCTNCSCLQTAYRLLARCKSNGIATCSSKLG